MDIRVIGDKDTVTGFRLAGIEGSVAKTQEEAESILESYSRAGIILINERLAALLRDKLKEIEKREFPIIVEIPGKEGPLEEDKLAEIYHQAVGLKMKK